MAKNGMTLVVRLPLVDAPDLREKVVTALTEFMNETVTRITLDSIRIDLPLANADELKEKTCRSVNSMVSEEVSNLVRSSIRIDQDLSQVYAQC
jgi:hypothetical protein